MEWTQHPHTNCMQPIPNTPMLMKMNEKIKIKITSKPTCRLNEYHTWRAKTKTCEYIIIRARATLRTAFIDLADIHSLYIHIVRFLVRHIVFIIVIHSLSVSVSVPRSLSHSLTAHTAFRVIFFPLSLRFSVSAQIQTCGVLSLSFVTVFAWTQCLMIDISFLSVYPYIFMHLWFRQKYFLI